MENAFLVITFKHLQGEKWLVSGRALSDISVGDKLFPVANNLLKEDVGLHFEVVAITTYDTNTDFLGQMWTGNLYLQANRRIAQWNTQKLVKSA